MRQESEQAARRAALRAQLLELAEAAENQPRTDEGRVALTRIVEQFRSLLPEVEALTDAEVSAEGKRQLADAELLLANWDALQLLWNELDPLMARVLTLPQNAAALPEAIPLLERARALIESYQHLLPTTFPNTFDEMLERLRALKAENP